MEGGSRQACVTYMVKQENIRSRMLVWRQAKSTNKFRVGLGKGSDV